ARLAALGLAVAALALLALQPRRPAPGAGEAILLTPGAAGVPAPPAAGSPILVLSGDRLAAAPGAAEALPDAGTLARRHPALRRLAVLGHGLAPWEWQALPGVAVASFDPPPLPRGVVQVSWPRRLALGETLEVTGRVVAAAGDRLRLLGPGGEEDAVALRPGGGPFRLRALPRAPGRHRYQLALTAEGEDGGRVEALGVEVVAPAPVRVLWLEDAPSLETREVKRWLADSGAAFAARSQVSAGRVRTELRGVEGPLPARFTAAALADFDLLVLEGDTLSWVDAGELDAAVREGLGVLRLPDRGDPAIPDGPLAFAVRRVPDVESLQARLSRDGAPEPPPLEIAPREIAPGAALRPLVSDRAGRVLAAARPWGRGTVAVSLVEGSWRWVRLGEAAAHRELWERLVATVARPAAGPRWRQPGEPARVGLPVVVELWTPPAPGAGSVATVEATISSPSGASWRLPLAQDPGDPERWHGELWPREEGWHRLATPGAGAGLHVGGRTAWPAWEAALRQDATRRRQPVVTAGGDEEVGSSAPAAPPPRPLPLRPLALLGAVAAVAWLWAEERLGSARQ
ncbi:MAG TPA: hypothetical protein VMT16_16365, partial [Thermoanaerobaculia bacterium]|nr:hypothetical protein [Thermoanaerobaculia bacterium]